jgi:GT2 family glycosyltransferase
MQRDQANLVYQTKMSKVLIGITSKNRASILPKSINSALGQHYADKEVAVFDDHSTDGTEKLAAQYLQVKWYFSKEEKGYLFARNMFLQSTDAVYYCSLDDDSWFLNESQLQHAVEYMDANPNVAVLAFKILSDDLKKELKRGNVIVETNNFIGCGHMLRVDAVKSVGSYAVNPGFYGGEEKDLCIRLMDKGYSIIRFPSVEIWHDKTSIARDFPLQHRSGVCNDLVFMWRRTPFIYLVPSLIIKLYKHLLYAVRFKDAPLTKSCLKGFGDFFGALFRGKIRRNAVSIKTFKKYLSFN